MKTSYLLIIIILSILTIFTFEADSQQKTNPINDKKYSYFVETIVPIIEQRCSINCHGVSESNFQQLMKDQDTKNYFYFPITKQFSTISKKDKNLQMIYEITKGKDHKNSHDQSHARIDYTAEAKYSVLLRKPLSEELGGLSHQGINVFANESDLDYQSFKQWIQLEIDAKNHKIELSNSQLFFKEKVQAIYARNGCFVSSCHNPNVFNDFKLQSPLPITKPHLKNEGGFSDHLTVLNHQESLGSVARLANLQGDVKLSRLIVKNLPLDKGGVIHKGGNNQFFESYQDQDVQSIIKWLELEKSNVANQLSSNGKNIQSDQLGKINGIVFIKGPKNQMSKFFNPDVFYPGSDIYILKIKDGESLIDNGSKATNISKFIHPNSSVHIQSFDISYDSKSIVFSMRKSINDSFRLYQIDLDHNYDVIPGSFTQLSFDDLNSDPKIHHIDPNYLPDSNQKSANQLDKVSIAFASNEHLTFSPSMPFAFVGEANSGDTTYIVDQQRTEIKGTFNNKQIHFLSGKNKNQSRVIQQHLQDKPSVVGSKFILNQALPYPVELGDHYIIENTKAENLPSYDIFQFTPKKTNHNQFSYLKSKKQITFSSSQERRPTVRSTGEIMFSSLRNIGFQGDLPVFNAAIYRVHNGGFDYHIQGGNRSRYPIYLDSREMPQGLEVRLLIDPRNLFGGGQLVLVDHGFGVNIEKHNPYDNIKNYDTNKSSSPPRFIPTQFNFKKEIGPNAITHSGYSPGGSFKDPYPLANGDILVSYTKGPINHFDKNSLPDFNLHLIKFEKGMFSDDGKSIGNYKLHKISKVYDQNYAEYNARPLSIRLKQKSQTHQKFATRTDNLKPTRVNGILQMPDYLDGELECYDYPLLESFLTNFAPTGQKIFNEKIKYVRILQQIPLTKNLVNPSPSEIDPFSTKVSAGIHTIKKIITEIPIASDGSFYARVPSNVPLIIQGLNSKKMALHSMNRFFYVQPGEKLTFAIPRSIFPLRCAGCHGSLSGNKVDGLGPPDLVSGASKVIATWDPDTQKRKKPYNMKNLNISIDFSKDIQPILDNKCISCHKDPQGLNLIPTKSGDFSTSYKSLLQLKNKNGSAFHLKKYINEREALSSESPLIEKLTGVQYTSDNPFQVKGQVHPLNNPLSPEELLTIIRWIDSGATFLGDR